MIATGLREGERVAPVTLKDSFVVLTIFGEIKAQSCECIPRFCIHALIGLEECLDLLLKRLPRTRGRVGLYQVLKNMLPTTSIPRYAVCVSEGINNDWASPSFPDTFNDMMCSGDINDEDKKELHGRVQT